MKKICLFVCLMCVALSLGLLGCQRSSNLKIDESGLFFIVEEDSESDSDSLVNMLDMTQDDAYGCRIRPYIEGYSDHERLGMVPDRETAIKIAESVWYPIYGSEIYNQRPFTATLEGDTVWFVKSSLPKGKIGGCAEIRLRKSDAAVLYVGHQR